jgi:hypothetical protein
MICEQKTFTQLPLEGLVGKLEESHDLSQKLRQEEEMRNMLEAEKSILNHITK